MRTGMLVWVAVAGLLVSTVASARSKKVSSKEEDRGNLIYIFKDDGLDGAGLGPIGAQLRVSNRRMSYMLIRPRLNFVSELTKSVEAL